MALDLMAETLEALRAELDVARQTNLVLTRMVNSLAVGHELTTSRLDLLSEHVKRLEHSQHEGACHAPR